MLKVTFLFQQTTGAAGTGRFAGFSETWYRDSTLATVLDSLMAWSKKRAGLLNRNAAIIGCRVQEIGGRTRLFAKSNFDPGALANDGDIPQMAVQCVTRGQGSNYQKYFQIRGIPDDLVTNGEFTPTQPFNAAFTAWRNTLQNGQWRFQAIDTTPPKVQVLSIAVDGTFVIAGGSNPVAGGRIILRRCKNTIREKVSGIYYVESVVDATHGKIRGWTKGTVGQSGTFAVYGLTYPLVSSDDTSFLQTTTRKVGRAFFQYRGRATKR